MNENFNKAKILSDKKPISFFKKTQDLCFSQKISANLFFFLINLDKIKLIFVLRSLINSVNLKLDTEYGIMAKILKFFCEENFAKFFQKSSNLTCLNGHMLSPPPHMAASNSYKQHHDVKIKFK